MKLELKIDTDAKTVEGTVDGVAVEIPAQPSTAALVNKITRLVENPGSVAQPKGQKTEPKHAHAPGKPSPTSLSK